MNASIMIGTINTLTINRETDNGLYLMAEDEEEVLLPNAYVKESMELDDSIDVFVYTDSEDRAVATTLTPKAMLGEFAFLEVVDTHTHGVFLDWGLPKDLFVPKREQKNLKKGDKRLFYLTLDTQTNRLIASQKIGKYLRKDTKALEKNQKVSLLIMASTPLGYKALIDEQYEGMLFKNEIFESIMIGDCKEGYIKEIRNDGKIDLSLQAIGKGAGENATTKIETLLEENGGSLPYTYKSDASEIQKVFGLSKKAYKKALTTLVDTKKIKLDKESIKKI
jgi:predicted RNA-binding protein (virulence factor B family)